MKRQDIQILRALAVLVVIVFHLNEEWLPFGYLGVDIFFVISGFVITRGILQRSQQGELFIARTFLMRRINRLLPALAFTVLISISLAYLLYPANELSDTATSSVYALGGLSNFYFFSKTDYFSAPLETMPLLHTWSLSTEEQFYLLFAFISSAIVFFQGRFLYWTATIWLALFTVSLYLYLDGYSWFNEAPLIKKLGLDNAGEAATFFLLPTRIYQLALGILAACFISSHGNISIDKRKRTWVWWLIFSAILGMIISSGRHSHIEAITLIICLLTMSLLIVGEASENWGRYMLLRPLVFIGDRSYSLYLLHWPVIVFISFYTYANGDLLPSAIALLLTFLIAEFSYRAFEKKSIFGHLSWWSNFHNQSSTAPSYLIYFILLFMPFLLTTISNNGFPQRIEITRTHNFFKYKENYLSQNVAPKKIQVENNEWVKFTRVKPKKLVPLTRVLVIGDSHAGKLEYMAQYFASTKSQQWDIYRFTGCPPLFDYFKIYDIEKKGDSPKQKGCSKQQKIWQDYIKKNRNEYDWVFLSSRWNWMFNYGKFNGIQVRKDSLSNLYPDTQHGIPEEIRLEQSRGNFIPALKKTIEFINDQNIGVVVFGQPPLSSRRLKTCDSVPKFLFNDISLDKRCNLDPYEAIISRGDFVDSILRDPVKHELPNFHTFVAVDVFCNHDKKHCKKRVLGKRIMDDTNHYNKYGAIYAAKMWEKSTDFPLR